MPPKLYIQPKIIISETTTTIIHPEQNTTIKQKSSENIVYKCEYCNYQTIRKANYQRHLYSKLHTIQKKRAETLEFVPHKIQSNEQNNNIPVSTHNLPETLYRHICICGKVYSHVSNLYRHRKRCNQYHQSQLNKQTTETAFELDPTQPTNPETDNPNVSSLKITFPEINQSTQHSFTTCPENNTNNTNNIVSNTIEHKKEKQSNTIYELLYTIIQENKDLQNQLIIQQREQNKQLKEQLTQQQELILRQNETINSIRPTINFTENNQYHQKVYNIQMFLHEKCQEAMTIQEFANTLELTIDDIEKKKYESLSNVILKNLRPLSITERPIHCSNIKKKEWFIHDREQGWEKDNGEKLIKQTEFGISKKAMIEFNKQYPNWTETDRLKDKFVRMIQNTTEELPDKLKSKLLNEVASEIHLNNEVLVQHT
jgi:hypothetical protein